MKPCVHCGRCCRSGIPCSFGQILFDITEHNPQRCPACESEDSLHWCGLIKHPIKWLSPMVGNTAWKCEAMADIVKIYIGIGDGCGVNPTTRQIFSEMRKYAAVEAHNG